MAVAHQECPDENRKIFRGRLPAPSEVRDRGAVGVPDTMRYHPSVIEFPPFRLDAVAGRLWRANQPVALRPKAWALLSYLVEQPGALVTKEQMHAAVWGDAVVSDDTLTRTLAELRRALRDDARTPRIIETVHRRGVRFIAQVQQSSARDQGRLPRTEAIAEPGGSLVGRETELARLLALFGQVTGGQRQTVFVQGEAGIGKSAIVDALLGAIRASAKPAAIGYGQSVDQRGEREPFMAVLEALERLGHGPSGARLRSVLRSVAPSWLAQLPALQKPVDAERLRRWHADATPLRMLREFASLVETISHEVPLVLVLEDLHWSDRGTVDLVSVIAQRADPARVMLVGTYRPAEAAALDHPIQQVLALLRARGRCVDIKLEYLSRTDVATYLARRLPGAPVADEVIALVHARSDGNPLFMIVLANHLLARGWLAEGGGGWRLTESLSTLDEAVPDNLRQLIEGQLLFASPEERDVLEVASVAGVAFDAPAVAAGLDRAVDAVEATCHRLCDERRWLRRVGARQWPDGVPAERYAFHHWLYQRTLYDRLAPSRRATLHERIGLRLETGFAGRTAEASGELARHFQGGRDQPRALMYLEQAAVRAYSRRAYQDVIACIEPALGLIDNLPDTPERDHSELGLRRQYAVVQSQTAGFAARGLLENLIRTQTLCERLSDSPALFDVLSALCLLHANRGDFALADEIGGRLSRLSEALDPSAALQADFMRGSIAVWTGQLGVARSLLASAMASPVGLEEAERPYAVNPVVAVRSAEALRLWIAGDSAGARAVQREGLTLAERHGRPFTLAHAATLSAMILLLEEDWAGASTLAARASDLSEEYGFARWWGTARMVRGRVLVEEGNDAQGLGEMREGLAALRHAGLRLGESLLISFLAGACLRLDRPDEGLVAVDEGLGYCQETGGRFFEAELWRLRGELILQRGRATGALRPGKSDPEQCFEKARAVARAQGAHMLERRAARREASIRAVRRKAR